eukprot:303391-Prymnesium_polylepis.1
MGAYTPREGRGAGVARTPREGPVRRFRPSRLRGPRPLAGIRAAHAGLLDLHVLLNLRALFAQPVAEHRPLEADARGVPWVVARVAEQNEPLVAAAIALHARPLIHPGKGTEGLFCLVLLARLLLGSFGPSLCRQGHALHSPMLHPRVPPSSPRPPAADPAGHVGALRPARPARRVEGTARATGQPSTLKGFQNCTGRRDGPSSRHRHPRSIRDHPLRAHQHQSVFRRGPPEQSGSKAGVRTQGEDQYRPVAFQLRWPWEVDSPVGDQPQL